MTPIRMDIWRRVAWRRDGQQGPRGCNKKGNQSNRGRCKPSQTRLAHSAWHLAWRTCGYKLPPSKAVAALVMLSPAVLEGATAAARAAATAAAANTTAVAHQPGERRQFSVVPGTAIARRLAGLGARCCQAGLPAGAVRPPPLPSRLASRRPVWLRPALAFRGTEPTERRQAPGKKPNQVCYSSGMHLPSMRREEHEARVRLEFSGDIATDDDGRPHQALVDYDVAVNRQARCEQQAPGARALPPAMI